MTVDEITRSGGIDMANGSSLAREFLLLAIDTEKNGRAFYESTARHSKSKDAQNVLKHLSLREKEHEDTFREMLKRLGDSQPVNKYTRDDYQYIKYLADCMIMDSERSQAQSASTPRTDIEAMELGIGLEKDCIIFYSEIRGMLPRADQDIIDMITSEEKKHLSELSFVAGKLRRGD
jgi:rubrerythrin